MTRHPHDEHQRGQNPRATIREITPTDELLDAVKNAENRDQMSEAYAQFVGTDATVDWHKVNTAIVDRWSVAALKYVKAQAWKLRP